MLGRNLFLAEGEPCPAPDQPERFDAVLSGSGAFRVERIVSGGQTTPEGEWYDQDQDEWVVVIEGAARLQYDNGEEIALGRGDSLFLPRHKRHRVTFTSVPCLWLAVHGDDIRME